jgi:hypothetical protein
VHIFPEPIISKAVSVLMALVLPRNNREQLWPDPWGTDTCQKGVGSVQKIPGAYYFKSGFRFDGPGPPPK